MRRPRDNRGFSLMEPLMIILIFSIFGFTAFMLIQAGDEAYRRMTENFNSQSGARVAMAYVQNRLCQNDREGAVSVRPNPFEEGLGALCIAGGGPAGEYDIWILWSDGTLLEFYGTAGQVPVREYCFEILSLSGFDVKPAADGQGVEVSVPYARSGMTEYIVNIVPLKTVQTGGEAQ